MTTQPPALRVTVIVETDTQYTEVRRSSDLNRDHLPRLLAECIAAVAESHHDGYLAPFAEAAWRAAHGGDSS